MRTDWACEGWYTRELRSTDLHYYYNLWFYDNVDLCPSLWSCGQTERVKVGTLENYDPPESHLYCWLSLAAEDTLSVILVPNIQTTYNKLLLDYLIIVRANTCNSKSKVDNLYCGSIIDPIAAEPLLQYSPCSLEPCHWLPHTGALTWKPSQGTKLYCLVNTGTLVWTTCPRSLPDNAAAGSRTRDLPIASPTP